MKFGEVELKHKAGVIPYYTDEEGTHMLFMKPSNAKFGGSHYQIAKGNIDTGEDAQSAAMREGAEELGLAMSNVTKVTKLVTQRLTGLDETYIITVYAAEIRDPAAFSSPHYETGSVKWMTAEEFRASGRLSQLSIVQLLQP
jgi:predicted NUDIX family NTP pyrophosphohydrolase